MVSSLSFSSARAPSSPQKVAGRFDVDVGQRSGLRGVAHQVLERVDVAQLLHEAHGLTHANRLIAFEAVSLAPTHLRERLAQVLAELLHLPAQIHVFHQLIAEGLELGPLLGRHRVEHLLGGGHLLGHLLEQLIERLGIVGEEVAELLHEVLEVGLACLRPRSSSAASR